MEYWIDDSWYVGRLREVRGVFSQGATMDELEENIRVQSVRSLNPRPVKIMGTHLSARASRVFACFAPET